MRDLDLSGSHVADRGFNDIALLTGLRTLRLRFLDITDAGLGGLAKLTES